MIHVTGVGWLFVVRRHNTRSSQQENDEDEDDFSILTFSVTSSPTEIQSSNLQESQSRMSAPRRTMDHIDVEIQNDAKMADILRFFRNATFTKISRCVSESGIAGLLQVVNQGLDRSDISYEDLYKAMAYLSFIKGPAAEAEADEYKGQLQAINNIINTPGTTVNQTPTASRGDGGVRMTPIAANTTAPTLKSDVARGGGGVDPIAATPMAPTLWSDVARGVGGVPMAPIAATTAAPTLQSNIPRGGSGVPMTRIAATPPPETWPSALNSDPLLAPRNSKFKRAAISLKGRKSSSGDSSSGEE